MVIGITGGVSTGKSTCTQILQRALNAHVINLDQIGHILLNEPSTQEIILKTFGQTVLNSETQEINRKALGNIVFSDHHELLKLNSIMHPKITEITLSTLRSSTSKFILIDGALISQVGLAPYCDILISVNASLESRRQHGPSNWEKISATQASEKDYNKSASHILKNTFDENFNCEVEKLAKEIIDKMEREKGLEPSAFSLEG
jgi:dephospho-CoA kinase